MKYRFKKTLKTMLGLSLLLGMSSCEKYLDINVNPILKSDVTMAEILPTAQFYTSELSYSQAYITCQYIQQIGSNVGQNGTDAQAEADNSGGWSNFYLNVLPNLNTLIKKSDAQASPAYGGIAKVLMAYNLGVATVNWENIPFTEADKLNFAPNYDSQESIYGQINTFLDAGIADLAKNTGSKPTTDDLIYGGDLTKWTKLAYTLKARYAMHQSAKNATKAATDALAALSKGFTSNADDFQLMYNSRNLSPWYSRVALANNTGNLTITFSNTLVSKMNDLADPRLPIMATLRKNQTVYAGVLPGRGSGATVDFTTAGWYSNVNSPIQMSTFAEAKAIEAEANFILNGGTKTSVGSTAKAYDAYIAMIDASMSKLGVSATAKAAFLAKEAVAVKAEKLKLENILNQKFVAMFLIGDIWTDYRRYDYFSLSLPEQHNVDLNGKWIQRMRYPSSETARNSVVAQKNFKNLTDKMWLF